MTKPVTVSIKKINYITKGGAREERIDEQSRRMSGEQKAKSMEENSMDEPPNTESKT